MNREYVKKHIIKMAHYFKYTNLDASDLDIYADHLADFDEQTLELALDRCIETLEWMPKVSQIREAAMANFMKRAGVPSPAEAWSEVSRHLRDDRQVQVGTLQAVNLIDDHQWSHPLVREAAEQIGWHDLWVTKSDSTISNRARYMDSYAGLVKDMRDHYRLNPDIRAAIEAPTLPLIEKPKEPEQEISGVYGESGFDQMPEHIKTKLDELTGKTRM